MKHILLQGCALSKVFSQGGESASILSHIDVDIYEGDFTVIMGASGAGKSTLLYCLSGMDNITGGEIRYQDQAISGFSENQMARLRAEKFGFVGFLDYETGYVYAEEHKSYDVAVLLQFLTNVMLRYPQEKVVMILDNAKIHHAIAF